MPRTKPAEERRADLLSAGRGLFVTRGIAATTLEDITSGAAVSKGLFYQYFRSKEDLVLALQQQLAGEFATRVQNAIDAQTDWPAKLDASVQACFDCYRDQQDLREVLFRHGAPQEAESDDEPAHAALGAVLRELLEAGVAAGAFHVDDPGTTAVLLYVTTHAFDANFHGRPPPTNIRLTRAIQQLFRRAAGVSEPLGD